jgi:hypothetical protein
MDAASLFLERCKQIETAMQSSKEIDLLDLSARLRQLLVDGRETLVHQANRDRRLKLNFRVGSFRQEPDQYVAHQSLEDGIDPETRPPGSPSTRVNFDGFLAHKVLYIRGAPYTVRDVIKHAADVAGGIHLSNNPDDRQQVIAAYSKSATLGGLPGATRMLRAIARVTSRGLLPLIQAIETSGTR